MIYFIRGQRSGMVKIGSTENLKERLRALKVGSPERLEIMALMEGGAEEERRLHETFAECRSNGEWFHPRTELLAFIEKLSLNPRLHPAHARIAARRNRPHANDLRSRAELIQLAADRAGLSVRAWYEKYALPAVVKIAADQLADPSDASSTLSEPASAEDVIADIVPRPQAAACS